MKKIIVNYLYKNKSTIKKIFLIYIVGSLIGFLYYTFLDSEKIEINKYVKDNYTLFFDNNRDVLKVDTINRILDNIKFIGFLWIIGFIPVGKILIYGFTLYNGYICAYSLTSFYNATSFGDFTLIILLFIIPNIFKIISYILISNYGIELSKKIISNQNNIKNNIIFYIILFMLSIMLSIIATIIESDFSLKSLLFLKKNL